MPSARQTFLAIVLVAFAGAAAAQGRMRRGEPPADGDRARQGSERAPEGLPALGANDRIQMQLNQARSALRLAPEQAADWQVYENKVVALLDDLQRGAPQPPGGNALRQIDARVDVVRNRLTALEEIADAAKRLYAGLSEEQKSVADRMLAGTLPALYSGMTGLPRRSPGGPAEPDRRR